MTVGLYLLQTYQNAVSCIRFYQHSKLIHEQLFSVREYLKHTIENMNALDKCCVLLRTYRPFIEDTRKHKEVLKQYYYSITYLTPHTISLKKFLELGKVMRYFYQLYNDKSLLHSLGIFFPVQWIHKQS